jgi:hypothetical protein
MSGKAINKTIIAAITAMKGSTPMYTSVMVPACSCYPAASAISESTSRRTPWST